MRKLLHLSWALAMILTLVASPSVASADGAAHVTISELQTGTSASASQEFIELYNPTTLPVSLSGWTIEYKSATATDTAANWTKRASLTGTAAAAGFYLVAPKSYLPNADADWSATLSGSAGVVRLKDGGGNVVDKLGYGTTTTGAEGAPAAAPPTGQSIERLPGRLDELAGNGVDTDVNGNDFVIRTVPQPQSTASLIELANTSISDDVATPPLADNPAPSEDSAAAPSPSDYAPIDITELLPNPMTPQLDSQDEFIELYNPTTGPVNLKGYTLRTGSNFHSYYVLPDTTLAAGAYLTLYASQTKLTMPNSGGAVALLDPSGGTADQTPPYGPAPDGQAWAYFDSGWAWTLQLTPGQPNVLAALAPITATVKPAKPKAAAKKATSATAKKVKTVAKKATKPRKTAKPKAASTQPKLLAERNLQPANWLIIILATLTIGYAIYEFRHDIYNLYHRLRGHTPPGPGPRPVTPGRGDD